MSRKIVVCGAGFLGSYIARELGKNAKNVVHLASRDPSRRHEQLQTQEPFDDSMKKLGDPLKIDVTSHWNSLVPAFEGALAIISLVGILHGTPKQFESIQLNGAENVARAAKEVGAQLVHVSAVGADSTSKLPYFRTKGLAEQAVFDHVPTATVLRPSLVFGPGDGFFARFATLSSFLPFMPIFGGGTTRFQPVYAGDIARFVSMTVDASSDAAPKGVARMQKDKVQGKIFEVGGPDVFTYREMMQLVLKYTNRTRPVISLPWQVGMLQGWLLEKLPLNILTLTRDQVQQLKMDNVAFPDALPGVETAGCPAGQLASHESGGCGPGFASLLEQGDDTGAGPTSVHAVLPTYLTK